MKQLPLPDKWPARAVAVVDAVHPVLPRRTTPFENLDEARQCAAGMEQEGYDVILFVRETKKKAAT